MPFIEKGLVGGPELKGRRDKVKITISSAKRVAGAVALALGFALCVPSASAAPVISAGDKIRLYDGPGTTGGGEFWVDVLGTGVTGTINASNNDFITFCLEKNEYFTPGQDLQVAAVNTAAVNGGVGGGSPDPLSPETAYLYTQFSNGTLSSYSHSSFRADSLQRAIWYLENEIAFEDLDFQAQLWVEEAQDAGWTSIGDVRVLNLLRKSGDNWIKAQDQLYIATPVPEPQAYALLLAGLGLMGFFARRRRESSTAVNEAS